MRISLSAFRAGFDLGLLFGYFHFHWRYIKYLAAFHIHHRNISQHRLAVFAALRAIHLDIIWLRYYFQCVAFMSGLSTAFLAARFSQAAVVRLLETISGRRFSAIVTVLVDLIFQRLQSGCKFCDDRFLDFKQCNDCLRPLLKGSQHIFSRG
jgi:hypothetical protein